MKLLLSLSLALLAAPAAASRSAPRRDAPLPAVSPLPDSALSAAERTQLAAIADPGQQLSFRITRAYLRICAATTRANAHALPVKPRQYNAAFVSPQEKQVVDSAVRLAIAVLLGERPPA